MTEQTTHNYVFRVRDAESGDMITEMALTGDTEDNANTVWNTIMLTVGKDRIATMERDGKQVKISTLQ